MQGIPIFLFNEGFPNISVDDSQVQINEAESRALIDLLKGLSNGDTLLCKVLASDRDSYTIQADEKVVIKAKADGTNALTVGSSVLFEVNKSPNSVFSLRPLNVNTQNIETAKMALGEAHIPVNGRSIEMTERLMDYSLPVDKKSLSMVYREVFVNSEAPVKDIVDMVKMNIPVTKENISAYSSYVNMENSVTEAFNEISEGLTDIVFESKGASDDVRVIVKNFNEIISGNDEEPVFTNEQSVAKSFAKRVSDTFIRLVSDEHPKLLKETSDDSLPLSENRDIIKSIFKDAVNKVIAERWTLEPEEVSDKPNIEELYRRLLSESKELTSVLEKTVPKESSVYSSVNNLSANLDFMNALNSFVPYVQIPFKAWDNPRAGELYVYKNKHSLSGNDSELSAFLHLDTKNLGPIDAYIKLNGSKVSTNFTLADEESLSFIEKNIELLDKRLTEKGYDFSSTMSLSDDTRSPFSKMLDEKLTRVYASKTSFDARI